MNVDHSDDTRCETASATSDASREMSCVENKSQAKRSSKLPVSILKTSAGIQQPSNSSKQQLTQCSSRDDVSNAGGVRECIRDQHAVNQEALRKSHQVTIICNMKGS